MIERPRMYEMRENLTSATRSNSGNGRNVESRLTSHRTVIHRPIQSEHLIKTTHVTQCVTDNSKVTASAVSVHQRNLYIIAFPVIFAFNLVHLLIYQLYCWCLYGMVFISFVFVWLLRQFRKWRHHWRTSVISPSAELTTNDVLQHPLCQLQKEVETQQSIDQSEKLEGDIEMWGRNSDNSEPSSDILSRQKQHHHRAFELISKALKLDEQNAGMFYWDFFINFEFISLTSMLSLFPFTILLIALWHAIDNFCDLCTNNWQFFVRWN